MIYYIRTLKTGEKYTTSYKDQATAKRIAGQETTSTNKKLWDGELFYDLKTGAYGAATSGVGLVSHIKCSGGFSEGGRYAVFSEVDGKPNDLGIRFKTYGDANKFVRAVAQAYSELWILEMEKVGSGIAKETIDEDIEVSDEAPF